jgi:serine O-acetyltransferase
MIRNKKDYHYYLLADKIAKAIPARLSFKQQLINYILPNYVWEFQKTLRKLEYYKNCKKGIFAEIHKILITRKFKKLSIKCGFSIPPNVFGPGLSIAHPGTIIVNGGTQVGANCRLHACVNIGTEAGYGDKAPQIGNNCYIAPGAKIYGDIVITDNIAIGANAVVNKSFTEKNTAIAGVPAKIIAKVDVYNILIPATEIIDKLLLDSFDHILKVGGHGQVESIKKLVHDKL